MNIIHLKYAIEVANAGSINKASDNLGMAQPNISRAIKDLESDIGIAIFDRSAKGMNLTPEGKDFIDYAQKILLQLSELESMYKGGTYQRQKFSVSAPRSAYIADAFAKFSKTVGKGSAEISLKETGPHNTLKNVISSDCKLGIIRYESEAQKLFDELFDEKGLNFEPIAELNYLVISSKNSDLLNLPEIKEINLADCIQITHEDPYAATLTAMDPGREALKALSDRCIYLLDSAAQFEILSQNDETFMWMSPLPKQLLERYNLAQSVCVDNERKYKDVLIYRKDYKLTETDKSFIEFLKQSAKECL